MGTLEPIGRVLVVTAVEREALAAWAGLSRDVPPTLRPWVLVRVNDRADLAIAGVGKSNAAGCVSRLFDRARHGVVVNAGIAGALPMPAGAGRWQAEIGEAIVGVASVNADEGVLTPTGFESMGRLGFGTDEFGADARLVEGLARAGARPGRIASVSTCSGTDEMAREVVRRTGAIAEAMEGSGAASACRWLGVPFAEVRIVSNTTGDRAWQAWDLPRAFSALTELMGRWS